MKEYTKIEFLALIRSVYEEVDDNYPDPELQRLLGEEAALVAAKQIDVWIKRGDGAAVYENADLGHPELGHKKIVSFGSSAAQLEDEVPPERLPDIGTQINWRYILLGVYRGEPSNAL